MSGRYTFEFFRCIHCGQTISIYDTEACCFPKQAKQGDTNENANADHQEPTPVAPAR